MQIPRNFYITPAMQMAYLSSVSKNKGAGYVNAEARASKEMSGGIRSETERLMALNRAGEARKRFYEQHKESLDMQRNELDSARKASIISGLINLGTLGLGYSDSKKTKAAAEQQRQHTANMLRMTLDFKKKSNPSEYGWYVSQPQIQELVRSYGLTDHMFDNWNTYSFGIPVTPKER